MKNNILKYLLIIVLFLGAGWLMSMRNNWAMLGGMVIGAGTLVFTLKSILK